MEDKKAAIIRKKSTEKLQKSSSKVRNSAKKSGKELFEFDNLFRQSDESDDASALNKSQNRW